MKNFIRYLMITGFCFCMYGLVLADSSEATIDELLNDLGDYSSPRAYYIPFSISAEPLKIPMNAGTVVLKIKVAPNVDCNQLTIEIINSFNIEFISQTNFVLNASKGDTTYYELEFIVPSTGRSGFRIETFSDIDRMSTPVEFSSKNNSIYYYNGDPKSSRGAQQTPTKSIGKEKEALHIQQFNEHKRKREMALNDTTRAWYYDSLHTWHFVDKDSLFMSLRKHRMTPKEKMLEMEESPLTYATQEDIVVEGKFYTRNKGEYKFRPLVALYGPDSDPTILQREDSIIAALPDSLFHLVFDLTDSEDFNYISNIVDQLEPMEQAGFYHALIWRSKIRFVEDREIKYNLYPKYPIDNSVPTNSQKKN